MDLESKLQTLVRYRTLEELTASLTVPLQVVKEPPLAIIPSLTLGTDGPSLQSLFLFTEHFLGEVTQLHGRQVFDFVDKATVVNYRFTLWTHEVKAEDVVTASFNLAEVDITHRFGIVSNLRYVGDDRLDWIDEIVRALPLSALLVR